MSLNYSTNSMRLPSEAKPRIEDLPSNVCMRAVVRLMLLIVHVYDEESDVGRHDPGRNVV